ncbi:MAG: aspartate aminotransferase family protein [Acidobacteriales bacterium]|nr:aspartate aminotransferase family protein [Terriglobales bacterium]
MTKEEILLACQENLFPCVFHYYREPLVVARAKGQYVWDADGRQYLDFFGGIVTISVGHANEFVNRRVHEQLDRLQHVSTVFATEPIAALARKIASITPGGRLTKCFFTNSGTEANETAILAARCATGSSEIVALRHAYHGRSILGMTLTGQSVWRLGGVAEAGIVHAHNAYCYRCPFGLNYPACEVKCARDVEDLIRTTTSGRIAGFIAEPVQGVGGFITPPKEYFPVVADIVRRHGGVFISDEVQTAWGRTGGKWFGIEHWGVVPDIMTSAKGLGNGMPIGLTVATPEVAAGVKGLSISTFGGNPITTTAAKAVIDFVEQERLMDNAATMGAYLHEKLIELKDRYAVIGDVRGMGLMQAIELVRDRATKEPAVDETLAVLEATRRNGLLVGKGGLYSNIIRITPPLNISRADVDAFAEGMERSLRDATGDNVTMTRRED